MRTFTTLAKCVEGLRLIFLFAFCLYYFSAAVFAREVDVIFDESLTNGTGWVYGPKISFNKKTEIPYICALDGGQVISGDFGFAVTSVVIVLENTTETEGARKTKFSPVVDGVVETNSVWTRVVMASGEKEEVRIEWPKAAGVKAFSFYSGTGGGNTYFYEAKIFGVGIAVSPEECKVVGTDGTSFTVEWKNGDGVISNWVDVAMVEEVPFCAGYVTNFTFGAVSNFGKQASVLDAAELGDGFGGWVLKVPTNSVGIVQLGSSDKAGGLVVRPGLGTYEGVSLVVRARRYPGKDEGVEMPVQWVRGARTNDVGKVVIGDEMREYVLGLDGVDAEAEILIRSTVKKGVYEGSNRRVWLDFIGFARNVVEAHAVTNFVARKICRGRARARVCGLERATQYIWTVRAFNEQGEDSLDIGWMEAATTDEPPKALVIRLQ